MTNYNGIYRKGFVNYTNDLTDRGAARRYTRIF